MSGIGDRGLRRMYPFVFGLVSTVVLFYSFLFFMMVHKGGSFRQWVVCARFMSTVDFVCPPPAHSFSLLGYRFHPYVFVLYW